MNQKTSKVWLFAGAALISLAHMRWGIGALGWFAPIPLLVWLRRTQGIASRALLGLALLVGYAVAAGKMMTAPVPLVFGLAYAVPMATLALLGYLAWDAARRRGSGWVAPLVFAATTTAVEVLQHRFTELGSWGAVAYTQVDNLPLLQVSALVGMAGVSFLVCWVAAALESFASSPATQRPQLAAALAVTLAALLFGALRLGLAAPAATVAVAAVGTDSTVAGFPYPALDELERINEKLFGRTAAAAERGAKLVAWTEAAALVPTEKEPGFLERLSATAARHHIELVAAYIVPHDTELRYENKYVWVRPDGAIDHTYHKHHPVPGEPATPGTEPHTVVSTAAGRAAAAICYDFDFPALARQQAVRGVDLAVVPSSDWLGIDPIHTQMASVRAIENGFSLLRSTRWGLTAAYDPYGRARAWQSSFDQSDGVVMVSLPRVHVATLYTRIGDAFAVLCAAFAIVALAAPRMRLLRAPLERC